MPLATIETASAHVCCPTEKVGSNMRHEASASRARTLGRVRMVCLQPRGKRANVLVISTISRKVHTERKHRILWGTISVPRVVRFGFSGVYCRLLARFATKEAVTHQIMANKLEGSSDQERFSSLCQKTHKEQVVW